MRMKKELEDRRVERSLWNAGFWTEQGLHAPELTGSCGHLRTIDLAHSSVDRGGVCKAPAPQELLVGNLGY